MARCRAVALAYLPNKKILFLIAFILLVFAGWFYFSSYENKQTQYIAEKEKSPLVVVAEQTSSLASTTSDWLLTLPQNNPSDREDVLAKTNQSLEGATDTITASYAKQFLTNYLLLKQTKGELTQEDKQNLVNATMKDIKPLAVIDKYVVSDLKISNDISKESIKKYSDEMKKVLIDERHTFLDDEALFESLLKKIKDKKDDYGDEIWGLDYSSKMYDWLAKQLILLTVPASLAKEHLTAINGFNNAAIGLKNMMLAPSDPIKSMMGLKLQEEQIKRAQSAIENIQTVFDNYKIYVF